MNIVMLGILLIRIIIWLTFLLLILEAIAVLIAARWFYKFYTRKHLELITRITSLEIRNKAEHRD